MSDSPPAGLYGSDIGANMLRASSAELAGTFLLVFTGTAVAVSRALSRAIAGDPPTPSPGCAPAPSRPPCAATKELRKTRGDREKAQLVGSKVQPITASSQRSRTYDGRH